MNCRLQKPSPFDSVPFCTLPKQCYLSVPLEFLALLGFFPAHILWPRKHAEIQIELSWSAKFVCILVHVIRPEGLFFFFNRTFFLVELSLGSRSFQICGNLGPVFSSPDALSVVAFFQSVSRCCCLFILFPAHFILS